MVTLNVNGLHLHKTNVKNKTHIYAGLWYKDSQVFQRNRVKSQETDV